MLVEKKQGSVAESAQADEDHWSTEPIIFVGQSSLSANKSLGHVPEDWDWATSWPPAGPMGSGEGGGRRLAGKGASK